MWTDLFGVGEVSSVAFSSDGHTLAAGSNDRLRLWNLKPLGHTGKVSSTAFALNGATGSS